MVPEERFPVDILLEQPFAHHLPVVAARAPVGLVGALVDNMSKVVEPAWMRRTIGRKPRFPALPPLPAAGGEAEDLGRDPAAFQRAGEDVGADRRNRDGATAHRS